MRRLTTEQLLDAQKIQAKALVELAFQVERVWEQLQGKPNLRLKRAVANAWEALGLATYGSTADKKRKKIEEARP